MDERFKPYILLVIVALTIGGVPLIITLFEDDAWKDACKDKGGIYLEVRDSESCTIDGITVQR